MSMADDAVTLQSWQEHLESAFKSGPRLGKQFAGGSKRLRPSSLSRAGAHTEATSLWHVASLGLRVACLVASYSATQDNVVALQSAIIAAQAEARTEKLRLDHVALIVHAQSEQIFVVNTRLFTQMMKEPWDRRYFCISDTGSSDRSDASPDGFANDLPIHLEGMLNVLSQGIDANDLSAAPPVLILNTPRWPPSAGIALAGWLLEYEVVYFAKFISTQCDELTTTLVDANKSWPLLADSWSTLDSSSVASRLNNLPLMIVTIYLRGNSEAPDTVLYQFSVPETLLASEEGIAEGTKKLESRISSRLYTRSRGEASIKVTFERQVRDRVAI